MKDPHDIRKAAIEDEIVARSEERESTKNMNEPCDECGVDTVALLDERDQLRAKCERLEAQSAQMRKRLKDRVAKCCEPDGALDGVFSYCAQCKLDMEAMSTTAGTAILARLEEARRLLEELPCYKDGVPRKDWMPRRDQWLKGGQP